jgi:uncharacterized membrane protein
MEMRSLLPFGCLGLIVFAGILILPLFFADLLITALDKLGLSPLGAGLAAVGIFIGGLVNIPIYRFMRETPIEVITPTLFGLRRMILPGRGEWHTILAVNVGGALVPISLALYEIGRIASQGGRALTITLIAALLNIVVCYWVARPVAGVGIALNPFIPAILAALSSWLLLPSFAPPVAFTAGVLGPVVGADLLHIPQLRNIRARVMSIGGAGTFDGIVLSGLAATLLA